MRTQSDRAGSGWVLLLLLMALPAVAINLNPSMEELRAEAFVQWNKWIVSRDVEKRRSAAESLGSFDEEPRAVALLVGALPDKDAEVRRLAAGSLWKLADGKVDIGAAQPALRARLDDPSPAVRVQAAGALERAGVDPRELVASRRSVLQHGDAFDVALAARDLIGSVDGAELVDPLLGSLRQSPPSRDDDVFDAGDVLEPLARDGSAGAIAGLMRALEDPTLPKVPLLKALGSLDPTPSGWKSALVHAARDPEAAARATAADQFESLVKKGHAGNDWIDPLLPLLRDPYVEVRLEASELFGEAGGEAHAAVDPLLTLLAREDDARTRRAAIRALAAIGDPAEAFDRGIKAGIATRARPALEAIAVDAREEEDTREAAQGALQSLTSGTATHTRVLTASAPGDAGALARLRARDIEFTEDAFWRAIGDRDVQAVKDLLDAGLSPKSIDAGGMPPLHFTVMGGCDYGQPTAEATKQIVAALLAHGADPNQRDTVGDNPVLHRASSCDATLVRQLIAAKADVRAKNHSQLTAFPIFVSTSPAGAAALLDAGYRADAKERVTVQAMLMRSTMPPSASCWRAHWASEPATMRRRSCAAVRRLTRQPRAAWMPR